MRSAANGDSEPKRQMLRDAWAGANRALLTLVMARTACFGPSNLSQYVRSGLPFPLPFGKRLQAAPECATAAKNPLVKPLLADLNQMPRCCSA